MSAASVISWMLARSPRPSAISPTAASMRACRVWALRRSSRLALGASFAGTAIRPHFPLALHGLVKASSPNAATQYPQYR